MRKAFEKQTKTIEDQGEKQVDILQVGSKPKELEAIEDNFDDNEKHIKYKDVLMSFLMKE